MPADRKHSFTVEFFQLSMPSGQEGKIEDLFAQIKPNGRARMIALGRRRCGVYVLDDHKTYLAGRVGLLDFGRAPHLGDMQGNEELVKVDGKGVLHDSHFLYFTKSRVLVMQFSLAGIRASKLVDLLGEVTGVDVDYGRVMTLDAVKAIKKFGRITDAGVRVAFPTGTAWQQDSTSTFGYAQQGKQMKAGSLNVIYSAPRGCSLDGNQAIQWMQHVMREGLPKLARIWGKGKTDSGKDGTPTHADLIEPILRDRGSVPIIGRDILTQDVFDQLVAAYDRNRGQIEALYRADGSGN